MMKFCERCDLLRDDDPKFNQCLCGNAATEIVQSRVAKRHARAVKRALGETPEPFDAVALAEWVAGLSPWLHRDGWKVAHLLRPSGRSACGLTDIDDREVFLAGDGFPHCRACTAHTPRQAAA